MRDIKFGGEIERERRKRRRSANNGLRGHLCGGSAICSWHGRSDGDDNQNK